MKRRIHSRIVLTVLLFGAGLRAQSAPELTKMLERLTRLEAENDALRRELAELRRDLETRVQIQERRVDEQAQTKVESAEKFPIRMRGMLVANLFQNSPHSGGVDTPTSASRVPGRRAAGIALRQSVIGMEFRGPETVWGGKVDGSIFMDFFEGTTELNNLAPMRVRTGHIGLHWNRRSVTVRLDKPLFSPRDPSSFSYIGVSPLTGSGNLWRWQQQVRLEQRLGTETTGLRAQAALVQTTEEVGTALTPPFPLERRRPGLQGRFAFFHRLDRDRSVEIAPSFHASTTHAGAVSVPSRLFAVDWFANPLKKVQFTGMFFAGRNVDHFGGTRQGFTVRGPGVVVPVQAKGGWGQVAFPFTDRVRLNLFGGMHDPRNRDLLANGLRVNRTGAANLMYQIAPNVFVTMEALQLRSTYPDTGTRKNNRYDLSLVYLF
jgi:hypothetical protein